MKNLLFALLIISFCIRCQREDRENLLLISFGGEASVSAITSDNKYFIVNLPEAGGTTTITHAPSAVASDITKVKVNIAAAANADIKIGDKDFTQGQTVDFSAPVTFTVTAEDGTTVKSYRVHIMPYNKETNPYGIYTAKHLADVNNGLDNSYLLMNNIDLPNADAADAATATGISDYAESGWLPLGAGSSHDAFTGTDVFTGTFDGGNFSINNFYVKREAENAGLFGAVGIRGAIKNLGVNGVITGTAATGITNSGHQLTGILAGYSAGTIDKCYATGNVYSSSASSFFSFFSSASSSYAGGLAGYNDRGRISDSYATGSVSSSSSDVSSVGGLTGYNDHGRISNSYAAGSVSASSSDPVAGGLAGSNDRGRISNSHATGSVSVASPSPSSASSSSDISYAGGLVGSNNNSGHISNSYAAGSVSSSSSDAYAGGLAGYNDSGSRISNSYATGSVSASSSHFSYAGGLLGGNYEGGISNSYATGSASAASYVASYAGGLVGYGQYSDRSGISNSYATGNVSSSASDAYAGGFVGNNGSSTFTNCYRNSDAAIKKKGQAVAPNDASSAGITPKTKAEMQTDAFKGNLNISGNTWGRNDGTNDKLPFIIGVGAGKKPRCLTG